ncbi:MAG: hypothetical protein AAGH87_00405 [Pseudomonadota bacterium]
MASLLSLEFVHVCERPSAPAAFKFVTSTVSAGGDALFLYVENDPENQVFATETKGGATFPRPRMREAKAFSLCILGSEGERWLNLPPVDIAFPKVEMFPDGRVLLAGARCRWRGPDEFDRNGVVYDPKTGVTERILLGDGIEDIAIDEIGRIWVSYFDEGVFGNFGWGRPGPAGPGSGGLVCFAADGDVQWQFNRKGSTAFIEDCYAMHASRSKISVFYYSDFHVCEIDMNFEQAFFRPAQIAGSHALVTAGSAFLLSSQYDEPSDTMHLLLRDKDRVGDPQRMRAKLPNDWTIGDSNILGRCECLHMLNERGWFRAELSVLVADLT